jgi:hypothetical protein
MTHTELDTALKNLDATQLLTGTDLSTVRWAVQRQFDVEQQGAETYNTNQEVT